MYASNLQANLVVGFSNFCKFTLILGFLLCIHVDSDYMKPAVWFEGFGEE